ncbi:MAG: galactose-1-epimerase [Aeromonadaceae bacterium]
MNAETLTVDLPSGVDCYADEPRLIRLQNHNGMQLTLMDWGATWLSCLVPLSTGERREVLLGCRQAEHYSQQQVYLGATVGRYANRIAKGHLPYPGGDRQLSTNQAGNTLHGGAVGFDKRRWQIAEQSATHVCFTLISPDGDQGFPGELTLWVSYHLDEANRVRIQMQAKSDALTPVNLTNHAYFNLDGKPAEGQGWDVRQHRLRLKASQMVPTDESGIPLGTLYSVAGTGFDFQQSKRLSQDFLQDPQQQQAKGYDHSYLLESNADDVAAELVASDESLRLQLSTSLPGLQLYTGNYLAGTPDRQGGHYPDYAGVALEPQFLPDSPHHAWPQPSCWLAPGQSYQHWIDYRFI